MSLTLDNAHTNIVFDGNSLFAGAATTTAQRIGEQLMQLAPISGAMTYQNVAINGQTFAAMATGHADVDAAFQAGKQNLLFILEGRNAADMTRSDGTRYTAADIIADCKAYIAAVKGVHPEWRVYPLVAPAYSDADPSAGNAAIDGFNAYLRTNYVDLGAEGYVETRPTGGAIAYSPPYTGDESRWSKSGYYVNDGTHLNGAGNAVIAQYMANMLPAIPAVAPPGPVSVSSDLALSYAITGAATAVPVSKDLALGYAILAASSAPVVADLALAYAIASSNAASITVPASRTAVFAGRTRVVVFGGDGAGQSLRYLNKGALDVLFIVADVTKDLAESGTTIDTASLVVAGVTKLGEPSIQGNFVVAKIGGYDLAQADNLCTFRLKYVNGEQADHTVHFRLLDDRTGTFVRDPDDKRFYALDLSADVALGRAALASVATPIAVGVQALSVPAIQGTLVVVMIGGMDVAGGPNTCTLPVNLANGEQIVRTLYFSKVDN